ncbi:protein kinase domain containing protein [Stylonychia lemnae]|uniref:Protein kinase domain containing protein n=1 Tax=Stylonychia lemnae TaxID=5949 RepID=A0A078AH12_STYLE|nr:protein kinase domain containing protein [Stylonychia lemnae]|eukprot:CDW81524.1 protein kinase domain containing protein [Stylonychia lemnae]
MEAKLFLSKQWFIDSHQGNIKEQYHFVERLGAGGFGVVYLAQDRKTVSQDHPNIIKLYEIWEWQSICFLVTEYCEGGELFYFIVQRRFLNEREAALIMKQSFSALKYLHENKISHRDIKPENFLLKYKEDITNMKLIDFGLSKDYSEISCMQTPCGSPYYIAPEVFNQNYDEKCDLWSMGVVLYILLSGKVPFPGESHKEIIENVLMGEFTFNHDTFKSVSPLAKDLIARLLVKDVSQRYSAADAYNHPMIQNIENNLETGIAPEAFENMKRFIDAANLKKATLIYLAAKLPERDFEELRKLFIQVDSNGDGRITLDEFVQALINYGINYTPEETWDLMNKLDTNFNGFVDYTEFLAGCMKSKIYLKEDYLRIAFSYFDKDGSGAITIDELKLVLGAGGIGIPDYEIEKLMQEADINRDNQIDYSEFLEMMKKDLQK